MARKISCRGVAALEFALVFPVLFLMLYGLITYSIIFAVQHSLNHAASEGARASVRYLGKSDQAVHRVNAACDVIKQNLNWMQTLGMGVDCQDPKGDPLSISIKSSENANKLQDLEISLNFNYSQKPILPVLAILPVPERLSASASSQFSLSF